MNIKKTAKDCPVCRANGRSGVKIMRQSDIIGWVSKIELLPESTEHDEVREMITFFCEKCGVVFHHLPSN